jgi:hypothetical protein
MRDGSIQTVCHWCGDARTYGIDCARDDELRLSCNCGSDSIFQDKTLAADFEVFAAIMSKLKYRDAGNRN